MPRTSQPLFRRAAGCFNFPWPETTPRNTPQCLGLCFALLAVIPTAAGSLAPSDWPQFRGPGGLATSAAGRLPTTWAADKNIVWKTRLPGPGSSSPIVVGDRVFLTCYTGFGPAAPEATSQDNLKLHVLCLGRADGRLLWHKTLAPELPEQERLREDHGYASSTPAADGERVFVFFGRTGVFAFSHEGRELWRATVGSRLHGWGSAASPVLHRGLVLINASVESESLVALDQQTGKEVWRAGGIKEAWNTPLSVEVAGGKRELVVPIIGKVLAFDPDSGQSLWHCDTGIGWYMCPSAVAHDGVVYSIGGRTGGGLAVRTGGRGDVTASHVLWRLNKGSNVSSPVYHDGHLYFAHENLGVVYCVEASTGRIVYEERLAPSSGQIYSSPVLADGKLYYVSRCGAAFVLAARPAFEPLARNELGDPGPFNASPAVAGDRLLLRSEQFLYCLGERPQTR